MKLLLAGVFCIFVTFIKADILDKQSIEVSGLIRCCGTTIIHEFCEAPKKAKIELWDYFTVLPDKLLYSLEIENNTKYSFKWEDDKLFDVKPFLKIHVQCSDGTIYDEKYEFSADKSNKISQDVKVLMGPK